MYMRGFFWLRDSRAESRRVKKTFFMFASNDSASRFGPMYGVMTRSDPTYFPRPEERSEADRKAAERMLGLLKRGGDCRQMKVKQLRRSVRALQYENDLKLSIAVDRLASDDIVL